MKIQLLESLAIIGLSRDSIMTLKTNVVRAININVDNLAKMLIAVQKIEILVPRKVCQRQKKVSILKLLQFLNDLPSQKCSPMIRSGLSTSRAQC